MSRISRPAAELGDRYDVVVVGSGYGGGIAASRLARCGRAVCVLERGKEFQPGEYPDTMAQGAPEFQVHGPDGHVGSRTGLYELHVNEDINVFKGCGLGGTSLVNANVSLKADPRVYEDTRWPQALRDDLDTLLAEGYRHAEEMLRPNPLPDDLPEPPKTAAHRKSAGTMGESWYRVPINVTFEDGVNHVGVEQKACTLCGDCISGCNHGAKNTVLMNYLPDARNHGAKIFTQVDVRRIERKDGHWLVHYQILGTGREKFKAPTLTIRADVVVLGAGSLGSTEILLRSKAAGLPLSDRVGESFTGNGDVLGFAYNGNDEIRGVGFGHHDPEKMEPVGPCITSVIDMRKTPNLEDGMVLEEGSLTGVMTPVYPASMAAADPAGKRPGRESVADVARKTGRIADSAVRGSRHGAVRNTQTFLIMSQDDGRGRMTLKKDRLRIDWPGAGTQPNFIAANRAMQQASAALGANYLKNPTWTKTLKHNVTTVHPLGGCNMAEDASAGVVNHKGEVFSGNEGQAVHDGLYVCDGAVIPRPLGVNPLFTISAVSERCCALIAKDRGWSLDYRLPSRPRDERAELHAGIQFTETMRGYFSTSAKDDYKKGLERGKKEDSRFEFILTVVSDNVEEMVTNPDHQARIIGTVQAKALSDEPLTATRGLFNLFVKNPDVEGELNMVYRMRLTDDDGKTYYFHGYKIVPGVGKLHRAWPDTSTLYITVHEGDSDDGPVVGKGILRIEAADFAKQMQTLKVINARSVKDKLAAEAKFGRCFAGPLWQHYGGIFAKTSHYDPEAPPRKRRPLDLGAPEVHGFATEDGVELQLTRHRGGTKGPVMLSPGFGMPARSYLIDTVEPNLTEYLAAHGYDVWLFDYRASTDLPSSSTQFTVDDIATRDYPAAVAKVREQTGAEDVQVTAHCMGSMAFLMSMLSGLQGVRSAVCSALTTDPRPPTLSMIKAGTHLPSVLTAMGEKTMSTDFDPRSLGDKLLDGVMKLYPTKERCRNAVCRRILFQYGEVFKHSMLNDATHDAMHEWFGPANLETFKHVTMMIRKGHVVDADGKDVYLPHIERLAIPIIFLHGEENRMFLPEGSKITYERCREANGPELYERHVFPEYAHLDCFVGRDTAADIFPTIVEALDKHN